MTAAAETAVKEQTAPNFRLSVLGRKIAFSTLVQYAGKGLQLVLSAVALKLISNFLAEAGYGVYASITEYVLFFSTAANLGIFGNVVRLMADRPQDGSVFMNALVLRMATALIFLGAAVLYVVMNGMDYVFVTGTMIFCGTMFFDYISSICDGMLQANYLMGRATFALVIGRIVNAGVIFYVVKTFSGAAGFQGFFWIFAASLLASFITAGLSLYFVSRKIEWSWKADRRVMLKIFVTSLPYGIIFILNNLYFRFLPDYFSHQFLDDKHFASFNISFRIAQVLSLASTFLMFSALPGLTEYIEQGEIQKAKKLYTSLKKILFWGGTALFVFGSLIGPFVIALLTHEKYNLPEFWFVLPMMLLLSAISYGYDLVFLTLFAAGEDIWFLKQEFLALLVAGIFFGGQFFVADTSIKMALILLGAIGGELYMVLAGGVKLSKELD